MADCREMILSNDYADFIGEQVYQPFYSGEEGVCSIAINTRYTFYSTIRSSVGEINPSTYPCNAIPKIYTTMDTTSMESSGIIRAQEQPVLKLKGKGVIIGLLDTGIDYRNRVFLDAYGKTRIAAVWDQTIQTGTPPEGMVYGSEYRAEDINRALTSEDPYEVVPSRDENGHGTFMAGIAAGREDVEADFVGAAPEAMIAMVKLKPAKEYLKEVYAVSGEAPVYQETDLLFGLQYLINLQIEMKMPLVVFVGVGTNLGGHIGSGPLAESLALEGIRPGRCVVVPAGNEANAGHHFYGMMGDSTQYEDVEIRVEEQGGSFAAELWANPPETFSIAITSPSGEQVPRIPTGRGGRRVLTFIFERTVIEVDNVLVTACYGSQLIRMKFIDPTPGIWKVRVYNDDGGNGIFNIWLPVTGFIGEGTVFLQSNPDTTITDPGNSTGVITTGAYNHRSNSIYINSGRGYTRFGALKPDLAAPGVEVYGPGLNNQFTRKSGTSVAAAHVAGAAASLLSWGIVEGNDTEMGTGEVRAYLIRGAKRYGNRLYPNREWGYGALDLYQVFVSLQQQ